MTYVISDIHGRRDRFHDILNRIHFSGSDTLYVLGDVIDRNADGIAILSEIIDAGNIVMLLGNHEYMMLNVMRAAAEGNEERLMEDLWLWYLNGGEITNRTFQKLTGEEQETILRYLKGLPLNLEITVEGKDYLLIHGSPEAAFKLGDTEFTDVTMYAVWNRFDPFAENLFPGKTIVCGHTPTVHFTHKIPMEIFVNGNCICMDCGCAYPDGRLGCLCLETGEIIYSTDKRFISGTVPQKKRNVFYKKKTQ